MWMPNAAGPQSPVISVCRALTLDNRGQNCQSLGLAMNLRALLAPLSMVGSWATMRIPRLQLHKWVVWIKWWESWWDFPDGKWQAINRMETTMVSHLQSLQLPKISVAHGSLFPWILFSRQKGPKALPLRGCHLTPRSRHRASMCWVRETTYPWGNCSPACSPSKGHVGAVQGWTPEPSLNFFSLAFVWIKSRRQRATVCRKHSIKVLARLPPPCHIPSRDTPWLCSPAAALALCFWIHMLRTAQFPCRLEKPHAAGVKIW